MLIFLRVLIATSQSFTHRYMFPTPISGSQIISLNYDYQILCFSGRKSSTELDSGIKIHNFDKVSTTYQTIRYSPQISPSSRYLYGLSLIDKRWVYLFGGLGDEGCLGDFWTFNIEKKTWTEIFSISEISPRFNFAYTTFQKPSSNSTFFIILGGVGNSGEGLQDFYIFELNNQTLIKTQSLPSISEKCSKFPISGAQIQYLNDELYLFSGIHGLRSRNKDYFKGLCKFSFSRNEWEKVNISAGSLVEGSQGGSFVKDNSIFYYFGKNDVKFNEKIYKLDLNRVDEGWNEIKTENNRNCQRSDFGFTALITESGYLDYVLFAYGNTEDGYTGSFGYLDIYNNSFINISCNPNIKNSLPRNRASIIQISDTLLLFGGTNAGHFFNDIWRVNYTEDVYLYNWTLIEAVGAYPKPRMGHAAASQGHFMLIAGGLNSEKNFISDFWLLDCANFNYKWIEIIPQNNSPRPPPLAHSCAILDIPYFYLIGGESNDFLTADIWRFDLSENVFEKARFANPLPGISRHGCYLNKEKKLLFTFFGAKSLDNTPNQKITSFNIENFPNVSWEVLEFANPVPGRSNFGYSVLNSTLFIAGGQEFFTKSFSDVWAVDLETKETFKMTVNDSSSEEFRMPIGIHSMNFAAVGGQLILYSGLEGNGDSLAKESSESVYVINITSFKRFSGNCGNGTVFNNLTKLCHPCPKNSYKDDFKEKCTTCDAGTYLNSTGNTNVLQCLPCQFGYSSKRNKDAVCEKCTEGKTCFVGADRESEYSNIFEPVQPKIINPKSNLMFVYVLFSVTGFLLVAFVFFWIILKKFRTLLASVEIFHIHHLGPPIFVDSSERVQREDPNLPKINFVGGFFTGAACIVFFSVLIYYSYIFKHGNTFENITLESSSTLIEKRHFDREDLLIQVGFSSLRNFERRNDSILPASSSNVELKSLKIKKKNETCIFQFEVGAKKIFQSGDFIHFKIICPNCFTSDISVAVEANAGYHDMKSRGTSSLALMNGQVFKGSQPSRFFFQLSPAVFEDFTERNQKTRLGYRVSSILMPEQGTTSELSSLYFHTHVSVRIEFTLSQTGVYTALMLKIDNFGYITMAFGALSGSLAIIIILMKGFEFIYLRLKYRKRRTISLYTAYMRRKTIQRENTEKDQQIERVLDQSYNITPPIDEVSRSQHNRENLAENKISSNFEEKNDSKPTKIFSKWSGIEDSIINDEKNLE